MVAFSQYGPVEDPNAPPVNATGYNDPYANPTSSSSPWDAITSFFGGGGGGGGPTFGGFNASSIPAIATAINQWNNSGKYMDMATKYADKMDPFGNQRPYYQDRLKQLTEDPNAYLNNSPDYKAALQQGLGALDSSMSAKGFSGSGHAAQEAMGYGSRLASQFLDKDRQSLMQMAGAQIGPAAAAALIGQGLTGSIKSQDDALAALTQAFTAPFSRPSGNPMGTQPGGGLGGITSPMDAVNRALRNVSAGGGSGGIEDVGVLIGAVKNGQISMSQIPAYWRPYVTAGLGGGNSFDIWAGGQGAQEGQIPIDAFGPSDMNRNNYPIMDGYDLSGGGLPGTPIDSYPIMDGYDPSGGGLISDFSNNSWLFGEP